MLLQGRVGRAGSARSQRSVKSARSGKSSYSNLVEERMQLSKEQMHRIETAFSKYDSERKGSVNRDQMGKIMEELGHRPRSDQELEGLLRWAGKHTSTGKTSFDEYVEYYVLLTIACAASFERVDPPPSILKLTLLTNWG